MKLASSVLLSIAGLATASETPRSARYMTPPDIKADSELGQHVLAKARRVNEMNYYYDSTNSGYYYGGVNYNPNYANSGNGGEAQAQAQWYYNWQIGGSHWLNGYAIKFQGCYDTYTWNYDAADANDVRLKAQHLVRFRLCPIEYCGTNDQSGCHSNYGDYIIDLDTFLESYIAAKYVYEEWQATMAEENGWVQQTYGENYAEAEFDVSNYYYCQDSGIAMSDADMAYGYEANQNGNNNGNNNNYKNNNYNYNTNYYMGPYCGSQGGKINMGLFKDEYCTIPASSSGGGDVYFAQTGTYLPFSEKSMIEYDCFACAEPGENNYAGDDYDDEDDVNDICETAYLKSGKCEQNLPTWAFNAYKQKNNQACNYIDGIKASRSDGSIVTTQRSAPGHLGTKRAGAIMIALFGSAFVGLSYYVYYLKNKFERASIEIE